MDYHILMFYLLAALLIGSEALKFTAEEHVSLKRIRRYVKRQAKGNCHYNMCNETQKYPAAMIRKLVEKETIKFKDLFGTVVAPYVVPDITSRNLGGPENMCHSESMLMFPEMALDVKNVWRLIVNVQDYRQAVHFEACSAGAKCFGASYLPSDQTTECVQKKILLKMITFNENGFPFVTSEIPIPSGCVCQYTSI